ncbi:DUF4168 domain-containing protein [Halopseudomonas pelagia]|uniref:DUF4168 domain-containing protein n=1 Tax=Halopseudomonas pelagia TaxID=553151 RepID=A0AA91Z4E9_9GAMM|nr:DUF4168 domain-containing protein [Halopseudomonas pelagia]PCC97515.1 hypothetical protein CO192_19820 [Halopseudomonas pelagia]QFY57830.1 DUF4168 domain-containing protein [Halopseudomonas pelagia]
MTNLKTLTAAICFATFGFATTAAVAQEGAPAQPPAAQQAAAPISDADLEKFVEAEEKVAEIREEFTQKLNDAEDQEQAQSLQLEAQEKMMEAVGEVGIEVPVYNQIATRIQSDPELQQRAQEFN